MQVLADASQVASDGDTSVTQYLLEKGVFQRARTARHPGQPAGRAADRPRAREHPADMTEVIPPELAAETGCVPISKMGGILTIAVSNPFDVVKHDDLRLATGCDLRLALALEPQIDVARRQLYDEGGPGLSEILTDVDPGHAAQGEEAARTRSSTSPWPRTRRAAPGHQARQPDHLQRDQVEGVRHPHRAVREEASSSATASTVRWSRRWKRPSGSRTRSPAV